MKRLAILLTISPAAAMAHGTHVEIAAPLHETFHSWPLLGAVFIAAAVLLKSLRRDRE